jgi:transposase
MSYEELDRVSRVQQVIDGRLAQRAAGTMLGLTSRQVRRLCRAYETHGPAGLASKRRGRPSNRRLAEALRREALELVRARYEGFGPTLAHEKLTEIHNLDISVETLRHWMSEDGLWVPRARRQPRIQQPRRRRPCRGELIQIDGCDHEWFEDRGPRCTALVFVDDATTALMGLLFVVSRKFCKIVFRAEASFGGGAGRRPDPGAGGVTPRRGGATCAPIQGRAAAPGYAACRSASFFCSASRVMLR